MANPEILRQLIQEPHKTAQARSFQNTLDFLADATPTFVTSKLRGLHDIII